MRLLAFVLSLSLFCGCHVRSQTPSTIPSAATVSVLKPARRTDCPTRLREFRDCRLVIDGFTLTLESITPMPPARLTFGQPVVAMLRYSSSVDGLRVQVQPSNGDGCAGYDWRVEGGVERVPAGTGIVERTFTIQSAAVRDCGPGHRKIRVKDGEVFVERIRLLLAPAADRAVGLPFEQYLMADYRFGP